MLNLHNLHLATETRDRPEPIFAHLWYNALMFAAGALVGTAVIWLTSTPVRP